MTNNDLIKNGEEEGRNHCLKLQKEFQGRSYDELISHTPIVFAR